MSANVLPGSTIDPSPSICAESVARSESSMSVAASRSSEPCASSRIPERICTDVRVETARETTPSAWTSSSLEQVMVKSVSHNGTHGVFSFNHLNNPCRGSRECG